MKFNERVLGAQTAEFARNAARKSPDDRRRGWRPVLPFVLMLLIGSLFLGGCGGTSENPRVTGSEKINIIGYYGNSGTAPDFIPLIQDIPDEYNILIITFATFPRTDGPITFSIMGPYAGDYVFPAKPDRLIQDIAQWKKREDPFGRPRKALVSIGGENGKFPSEGDPAVIRDKIVDFIQAYSLDGLDIDLEGRHIESAELLMETIKELRMRGYLVTAAPEAAQNPLNAYKPIIPLLDWVHPQFYNNGPNAVTLPWVPGGECRFWEATDWQASQCKVGTEHVPNWLLVLETMQEYLEISHEQLGMLVPATPQAAGSHNNWNIQLLAEQVDKFGLSHVGTWAIAFDNKNGYAFAKAIAALMKK